MAYIASFCVLVCLLLVVYATGEHKSFRHLERGVDEDAVDRLEAFLFPNRTAMKQFAYQRRLAISKTVYSPTAEYACSTCTNMKFCPILEDLRMQETYLPKDTNKAEICKVVESLGERLSNEVFGPGRAFRDTPDCRDMVMQYMCLFYGSDSSQYQNYCLYREEVTNVNIKDQKLAPKAPCRSFCVQVATTCANDPTFIHTCARIPCPPGLSLEGKQLECTPDPRMGGYGSQGAVLAANLGCEVPYYRTPYNSASRAYSLNSALLGVAALLGVMYLL